MTNLPFKVFILIIHGLSLTAAISDVYCKFNNIYFDTYYWYSCHVNNNLSIFTPNEHISTIHGFPSSGKLIKDIKGLSIVDKQTEYLPVNLGEKFTDLIALRVKDGKLKKIDQDDLKSMPKLRYVDFDSNGLEVIERDLFVYNLQLEYASFSANRIKSVGENVFNNLARLNVLDMSSTTCVKIKAAKRSEVKDVLAEIKEKCSNIAEDIKYYRWKIDLFVQKNTKLRAECNEMDAEIESRDEKINQLDETMKTIQDQEVQDKKNYNKLAENLSGTHAHLKSNISRLEQEIIKKMSENQILEDNLSKIHQDITEIQQKIEDESNKIKQEQDKTKALEIQNTKLSDQLRALKQNKSVLNTENKQLVMEYSVMKSSDLTPEKSSFSHGSFIYIIPILTLIFAILDFFTTFNFFRRFSILRMERIVQEIESGSECVKEMSQENL